jgi:single-stranded DNA-binding protein
MKVTLRGNILQISEPRQVGSAQVVEIVINKKFYDQNTGELKGEDFYPVQVWDNVWPELNKVIEKGGMVEMQGFVNGRKIEKDGKPSFFCNIVAKSFKNI